MRTESHLHSTDELADGRHHVIPCPVPGHEGQRDSPGLDVRYSPEAAGRRPIGRQWLLRCWGDRCPYGSIVQALGIDPESASVGENADHMVAAYDHVDGLSRRSTMRGGPTISQIAPTCVRGGTAAGLGTIGIATPACVGRRQVRGCPSGARRLPTACWSLLAARTRPWRCCRPEPAGRASSP